MNVLAGLQLERKLQRAPFCSGGSTFHKTSDIKKRVDNMGYLQRNCCIFKVKIPKEVRMSENY